jgi:membrane protein DedA with SNARE-associated domain
MGLTIELALFFLNYPYLLTFLASVFLEESIVFFAFLSGSGFIKFYIVLIFGILGALIGDIFWYALGRSHIILFIRDKCKSSKYISRQYRRTSKLVHSLAGEKMFLSLLFSKFVFGSRILMMIYFGAKKAKFMKYLLYDLVSLIAWTLVLAPIGWLAGKGILLSFDSLSKLRYFIGIGIVFVIAFYLLSEFLARRFLHERD